MTVMEIDTPMRTRIEPVKTHRDARGCLFEQIGRAHV